MYPWYVPTKQGERGLMQLEASSCSRNYKTGRICRKQQRSTNTNCSKAPTQHQLSHVTESWMSQDRITQRNKTNEGQHGRKDKRKMEREENAWKIPM